MLRLTDDQEKLNQADKLVILASSQCTQFFCDQTKTAYMQIIQGGVRRNVPIRSKQFKAWLATLLWRYEGKAPGTEGVYGAMNVLEGKALFEGKKYTLYNRVAPANNGI
jgi:chitodextrinase